MQPRKDPGELRWYLYGSGFVIADETLVEEGKFICEIITAVPAERAEGDVDPVMAAPGDETKGEGKESIAWEVPWYYAERKDALSKEYVRRKLVRERWILDSKNELGGGKDTGYTEKRIEYLEKIAGGQNEI